MMRTIQLSALLLAFVTPCTSFAQESRTPVSGFHSGQDSVGSLFEVALKIELSRSTRYILRNSEAVKTKPEFNIGLSTVDVADNRSEQGKRSVVSVVIEDFGRSDSYPVATMWYHKILVVDKDSVGTVAKDLLYDMDARWCSHIKNSVGGCPKEKFYPTL